MKKQLSKLFAIVAVLLATSVNATADNDKVVEVSQLPALAQQTLKQHFTKNKVAIAKMETDWFSKSYDVVFTDGGKVEFDSKGNWTSIDCGRGTVPAKLVPAKVASKIKELYPSMTITEIEHDKRGYEVRLSNGLEIDFDKNFRIVDVDK